jgi:hypothetical protein
VTGAGTIVALPRVVYATLRTWDEQTFGYHDVVLCDRSGRMGAADWIREMHAPPLVYVVSVREV